MAEHDLTRDDMRRMAADIGLTRLTDKHLDELLRATSAAQTRKAALSYAQLHPADEPAHVFRLPRGDER